MSEIILQVENLSKEFRTSKKALQHFKLKDFIIDKFHQINPFQNPDSSIDAGTFWALKDLNFSVQQGDTIGIIGRNGAGKSTLLKILSKITPPTTGLIKRKGRVTSLLEVGTGFHYELSGRENIFLNGSILGLSRKEIHQKFDEIVAFSGVEDFLDTPIKRYSSGMIVRLAFSVAAHLEPDILIIDEVLAVGDLDFQNKCLKKMEETSRSGRTILFVSHNNDHILKICTKGILLNSGKLIEQGPIENVIQNYLKKSQNLAIIPLINRENREGNGTLKVTTINIFDGQNRPIETISPGQSIKITFDYVLSSSFKGGNILVSIDVVNSMGTRVFSHSNKFMGLFLTGDMVRNANQFVFDIQEFHFPQGDYFLAYSIQGNTEKLDAISDAVLIRVNDTPYGENLINPLMTHGMAFVKGKWSVEKDIRAK